MTTPQRFRTTLAASALAVLCGSALGANAFNNAPGVKAPDGTRISGTAQPVTLSAVQRASMADAFDWHARDAGVLDGVIAPREVFTEVIGLHERTDRLIVQVKSLEDMTQTVLTRMDNAPAGSALAAMDAGAPDRVALARDIARVRIEDARARVKPSRIEAFTDVDMHSVRLPEGMTAEIAAEALMRTGDYEYVSIDWLCYPTDTQPNDPSISSQWYHGSNRIDTFGAWDTTTGSGEIIAVCDSGVDLNHPDLAGALVSGFNSADNLAQADGGNVNDVNGHGTLVAGAAAAIGNNATGVSGIGWDFQIMPVRVTNNGNGTALLSNILQGARWASDNGAYVANASFGGAQSPSSEGSANLIRNEGHHLVFAAGNFGLNDQQNDPENLVIVGASNQGDNWATWSHTGPGVDCIAPGTSIFTTDRFGSYGPVTGTSFSAPITAGALALVRSANPALSADEVDFILMNASDDKEEPGEDDKTGWGRIDVGQAVVDAVNGPSSLPVPFGDDFADPDLRQWRDLTGDVGVSADAQNEPSGDDALAMNGSAQIRSVSLRAGDFFGLTAEITFWTQHSGVEAGEDLAVEYRDTLGAWAPLGTIASDGVDQSDFTRHRFELPFLGAHDDLRLRFTTASDESNDAWFIDDVNVALFERNPFPWSDDFEDGQDTTFDWASTDAEVVTDATGEPSGTQSAELSATDRMVTNPIDLASAPAGDPVYFRFFAQRSGVESGESLVVEISDNNGNWGPFQTIQSDGNDQTQFELHQFQVFPFLITQNTQFRLTAQGDEENDIWYIDDIAVSNEMLDPSEPCPGDLDGDGTVGFADLNEFVAAFQSGDPVGDLDGDGTVGFADLNEFVAAFQAGCP